MPIEPVRPRTKGLTPGPPRAERGVHLGPDAPPALEGRAPPGGAASRARPPPPRPPRRASAQEPRLERRVDEVGDDLPRPQPVERHAQRGLAGHAERGGVDDRRRRLDDVARLHASPRPARGAPKSLRQRLGRGAGAVGEHHLRHARLEERPDHRARGAARAQHRRRPRGGVPARGALRAGSRGTPRRRCCRRGCARPRRSARSPPRSPAPARWPCRRWRARRACAAR